MDTVRRLRLETWRRPYARVRVAKIRRERRMRRDLPDITLPYPRTSEKVELPEGATWGNSFITRLDDGTDIITFYLRKRAGKKA